MTNNTYPGACWPGNTITCILSWAALAGIMILLICIWRHLVITQWLVRLGRIRIAMDTFIEKLGRQMALPVLFLVCMYSYRVAPGLSPEARGILRAACLIVLAFGVFKIISRVFRLWIRYLSGACLRRLKSSISRG